MLCGVGCSVAVLVFVGGFVVELFNHHLKTSTTRAIEVLFISGEFRIVAVNK